MNAPLARARQRYADSFPQPMCHHNRARIIRGEWDDAPNFIKILDQETLKQLPEEVPE